jgi:two-component system sensor histidine kinase RpfC
MELLRKLLAPELRANPDYQSALVRLGIWVFSVVYIGLGAVTDYYQVDLTKFFMLFGVYLFLFLGLATSVVLRPVWPERRFVALAIDISGASLAIFLTGEAISPFYLLYIWLFISYGTRYGQTHLKVASVLSVLAYTTVLWKLGEWQTYTFEAVFFLLLLVLLPMYQNSLLRKLFEARQEAERANQAQSDFLATMTHELRTPLSGVIGMTRLLESTRLSPEQRDYVHSISSSIQLLRALIGDILDLSKIEAKKLHLETVRFNLRDTVLDVCNACESQALDKGLELVCLMDPKLPEQVDGDQLRLRQILFNLVGNAVKFTKQGEVVVNGRAAEGTRALPRPHLYLEVRDTGIGIAKEKLERIFDSFWQADDTTSRRFGGSGLGTTIARDLVLLMGGDIGVESEEGSGSVFWVRLPLLPQDFRPAAAEPSNALTGQCALVYESNATSRDLIGQTCHSLGLEFRALENISQLGFLTSKVPEVALAIIADSPEGEDLDGIHALLNRVLGRQVPVVFLTYNSRRLNEEDSGAQCLNKPFVSNRLGEKILDVVRNRTASRRAAPLAPLPSALRTDAELNILVAEDNAIAAKVIVTFLSRLGHRVTLTKDGEETLEQARRQRFDIAFIDLRMPRIDGLDFTCSYRAEEAEDEHLPIIALTANAVEDMKQEALDAGMDDFLTKPVDPEELREIIRRYGDGG